MYSVKSYTDEKNEQTLSREVTVIFTNGTQDKTERFRFALGTPDETVKKTVKLYLEQLNTPHAPLSGPIDDYVEPTPQTPSQSEIDKQKWLDDLARLQRVYKMQSLGVTIATPTQVTNLQTKIKNDFKSEYEQYIPLM